MGGGCRAEGGGGGVCVYIGVLCLKRGANGRTEHLN